MMSLSKNNQDRYASVEMTISVGKVYDHSSNAVWVNKSCELETKSSPTTPIDKRRSTNHVYEKHSAVI